MNVVFGYSWLFKVQLYIKMKSMKGVDEKCPVFAA